MPYRFVPRVLHQNELLFPAPLYGVNIPAGLSSFDVRPPTFVSFGEMQALLSSNNNTSGGLGIVHGLTKCDFRVRFSNLNRQWQQTTGLGGQSLRQFQGGDVYLEITLNVYILESDRPVSGDPYSLQIFALIMEHELEHVVDEIDIINRWMPSRARRDQLARRYLGQATLMQERAYRHWFVDNHFTDWLKNGLWANEHNRRARLRDSVSNYAHLQQQIDQLRIQQVNQP